MPEQFPREKREVEFYSALITTYPFDLAWDRQSLSMKEHSLALRRKPMPADERSVLRKVAKENRQGFARHLERGLEQHARAPGPRVVRGLRFLHRGGNRSAP